MRKAHFLKENKGTEIPTRCIFFDTETKTTQVDLDTSKLELWFGQALYRRRRKGNEWTGGEWHTFKTGSDCWQFIVSKCAAKTKLYLYAHNLIFDLTTTKGISWLKAHGWVITRAIVDDPPTIITARKGKATIQMIDSFNYFKVSLADIGKSFGLDKLPMPSRRSKMEIWETYCKRDVEVLSRAMLGYFDFVVTNSLGNYAFTMASQAFAAFRHRFMRHRVFVHSNEKALLLERDAYHGGRTEAFFIGERRGSFFTLDINSMYPYVMADSLYPTRLLTVLETATKDALKKYLRTRCVVSDVWVHTPDPVYPVIKDGKLIFPVGRFRATLTSPELSYALAQDHVSVVFRTAIYEAEQLFQLYVTSFYDWRQQYNEQGNQAFAVLCKYMLNSLYGKFGQTGRVYTESGRIDDNVIKTWEEWDVDTHTLRKFRAFGGIIQELERDGESYNSSPAIAAHVTAEARMYLWKLILLAGRENVFYVDTDSLTVNQQGYHNLLLYYGNKELGLLKVEKRFRHLVIHGAKDYRFGDKTRIKGIRKSAREVSPGVFEQDRFSKFKGMVRRGDLDTMTVTRQTKHLSRVYNKGEVQSNGQVLPFVLGGKPA